MLADVLHNKLLTDGHTYENLSFELVHPSTTHLACAVKAQLK